MSDTTNDSYLTRLISERDAAVARADLAEAEVERLRALVASLTLGRHCDYCYEPCGCDCHEEEGGG